MNIDGSAEVQEEEKSPVEGSPESTKLLSAISTICLGGAFADGLPHNREIRYLRQTLRKTFQLTDRQANASMRKALFSLMGGQKMETIEEACAVVNANLKEKQKSTLFSALLTLLLSDGHLENSEIYYLEMVADMLGLRDLFNEMSR